MNQIVRSFIPLPADIKCGLMSGNIWSKLVDTKEKEIEALESQITLRYFLINLREFG